MKKIPYVLIIAFCTWLGGMALTQLHTIGIAEAQSSPPVVVVPADSGSGSAVIVPVPLPHDSLKDPVDDPGGFVGDLQTAKKKSWLGLILVGLYGVVRALGKLSKKFKQLEVLNKGTIAMLIAGAGVIIAAAIDALFNGGSGINVAVAALWAGIGLISPATAPASDEPKA